MDLARLAQLCTIIDHLEARPDELALHVARGERDVLLAEYARERIDADKAIPTTTTTKARKK